MSTDVAERRAASSLPGFVERLWSAPLLRQICALLVLGLIWEGYGRWLDNDLLFPPLSTTLAAAFTAIQSGELPSRILNSLKTLIFGYTMGVGFAALFTILAVSSRIGTSILGMLASMFNPLPPIALLPMAVLWFGIGQPAIIFVTMFSVTWVVALNAQSGFRTVSPSLRMSGLNFGLRGWRHAVFILIPAALPSILSGLKIGWAFAWRALIASELVFGASSRSGGLGWFIAEHRNALEIDQVFAGLLATILIGLIVEIGIFRFVERRTVIRWGMQQ